MNTYRIEYHDKRFAGTILMGIEADSEEEAKKTFIDELDYFQQKNIEFVGVKLIPTESMPRLV